MTLLLLIGARGSVVVKALRHKPEGRGFETLAVISHTWNVRGKW
jgi:hypothetical protein